MKLRRVVILAVIYFSFGYAKQAFELEAEDYLPLNATSSIINRDTASNRRAVQMLVSQTPMLKFDFCLDRESDIDVDNILYLNNGEEDNFKVLINGEEIGTFQTQTKIQGKKEWNTYVSTGKIGGIRLHPGRHSLLLHLTKSDEFGVEIDKVIVAIIELRIQKQAEASIDKQVFLCNAFCFDDISYEHLKRRDIPSARIKQKSTKNHCTEISNIEIPFYHNSVKSYKIRAIHPRYTTYLNIREPDWTNCNTNIQWRFNNITFKKGINEVLHNEYANLTFLQKANSSIIVTFFALRGQEERYSDFEIGSILTVELQDSLSEPITLGFSYLGHKEEDSDPVYHMFKPKSLPFTLEIPDFTWSDGPNNSVKIVIPNNFTKVLYIKTITLRKRPQKKEQAFDYYNDGDVVIQGVDLDFWWQENKKMTVKMNGKRISNANYIRVYEKIPWNRDQYGQTMVIYQDGMVRLLPITPSGTDWIPYGSSVLIGESDPRHHRPFASIKAIDISTNVKIMSINIFYTNGNKAKLHMRSSFSETILTISDVTYKNREENPFLTFMSMRVADGNSDADHVSVNGYMTHRITDAWAEMSGTSFVFYRKCLSKHNTASPDIQIEILS